MVSVDKWNKNDTVGVLWTFKKHLEIILLLKMPSTRFCYNFMVCTVHNTEHEQLENKVNLYCTHETNECSSLILWHQHLWNIHESLFLATRIFLPSVVTSFYIYSSWFCSSAFISERAKNISTFHHYFYYRFKYKHISQIDLHNFFHQIQERYKKGYCFLSFIAVTV